MKAGGIGENCLTLKERYNIILGITYLQPYIREAWADEEARQLRRLKSMEDDNLPPIAELTRLDWILNGGPMDSLAFMVSEIKYHYALFTILQYIQSVTLLGTVGYDSETVEQENKRRNVEANTTDEWLFDNADCIPLLFLADIGYYWNVPNSDDQRTVDW